MSKEKNKYSEEERITSFSTPQELLQEYLDGVNAININNLDSFSLKRKLKNQKNSFAMAIRAIDLLFDSKAFKYKGYAKSISTKYEYTLKQKKK